MWTFLSTFGTNRPRFLKNLSKLTLNTPTKGLAWQPQGCTGTTLPYNVSFFFFFFTLVTGPRRALSLKLSDTRVYEPEIRTRLGSIIVVQPVGCTARIRSRVYAMHGVDTWYGRVAPPCSRAVTQVVPPCRPQAGRYNLKGLSHVYLHPRPVSVLVLLKCFRTLDGIRGVC